LGLRERGPHHREHAVGGERPVHLGCHHARVVRQRPPRALAAPALPRKGCGAPGCGFRLGYRVQKQCYSVLGLGLMGKGFEV
jgi:hypothetical protein